MTKRIAVVLKVLYCCSNHQWQNIRGNSLWLDHVQLRRMNEFEFAQICLHYQAIQLIMHTTAGMYQHISHWYCKLKKVDKAISIKIMFLFMYVQVFYYCSVKKKMAYPDIMNSKDCTVDIKEARTHRACWVGESAEETNKTQDTETWTEIKGSWKREEQQALAKKNPAVSRRAAQPQARWYRARKRATCRTDDCDEREK